MVVFVPGARYPEALRPGEVLRLHHEGGEGQPARPHLHIQDLQVRFPDPDPDPDPDPVIRHLPSTCYLLHSPIQGVL